MGDRGEDRLNRTSLDDTLKRGKEDQGRKRAVAVRTRGTGNGGGGREGNVLDLLVESVQYYWEDCSGEGEPPADAVLERGSRKV